MRVVQMSIFIFFSPFLKLNRLVRRAPFFSLTRSCDSYYYTQERYICQPFFDTEFNMLKNIIICDKIL